MAQIEYAHGTCGYHGSIMLALMGGTPKGPATKELVEKFMKNPDERCIADESQVIFLFMSAMEKDSSGGQHQDQGS